MKKFVLGMVWVLLFCFFGGIFISCGTTKTAVYNPISAGEEELGPVQLTVHKLGKLMSAPVMSVFEAYDLLLIEAKKKYSGNIDVRTH